MAGELCGQMAVEWPLSVKKIIKRLVSKDFKNFFVSNEPFLSN